MDPNLCPYCGKHTIEHDNTDDEYTITAHSA